MKNTRTAIVFSVINLLLLAFLLTQAPSTAQQSVSPVVRARAIELVDEAGKVRAQLNIEEGGDVVFRLRDSTGTIRAKFGANEKGSGISLMDERTEATVQVRANQDGGNITLIDRAGKKQILK
jgi:hypothetical protein